MGVFFWLTTTERTDHENNSDENTNMRATMSTVHTFQHSYRKIFTALFLSACMVIGSSSLTYGQSLADYTAFPAFLGENVPPNILFMLDMGGQTIEAAYSGSDHRYDISHVTGTATESRYAANVTFDGTTGNDLVAVDEAGAASAAATTAAPADTFDMTRSYYGYFDPLRCYSTGPAGFRYAAKKTAVADKCVTDYWDGNFLNWLAMRKKDVAYQAFIGGAPIPAQANQDGTANKLSGIRTTGKEGSNSSCTNNNLSCWRYVKFVPAAASFAGYLIEVGGPVKFLELHTKTTVNMGYGGFADAFESVYGKTLERTEDAWRRVLAKADFSESQEREAEREE